MAGPVARPHRAAAQEVVPPQDRCAAVAGPDAGRDARGQYIDPAGAKLRVGTYAQSWAEGLGHLKPSTRARYQSIVGKHVVPVWGAWPLGAVAPSDVATWLAELSASGLRPGSVRHIHRVLSLILDAAVQDGRIGRNPAAGARLPRQVRGRRGSSASGRSRGWPRGPAARV
ncbi:MAG: hypothetical protein ABI131_02645 [Nostocoides sp.]